MLDFSFKKYFNNFLNLVPYLLAQVTFNVLLVQIVLFTIPKPTNLNYKISSGSISFALNNLNYSYVWPTIILIALMSIVLAPVFGVFIRLVVRNIIEEKEVNQLQLLRESFSYYWRFVGIIILMALMGIGIGLGLFIIGLIPFLGILAILAGTVFIVYLATILTPWLEYMAYDNLTVSDSYERGGEVGKSNFWRIFLLTIIISILTSIINRIGYFNLIWASVALFLTQAIDAFRIVYVMSLCKSHKEQKQGPFSSDVFTEKL